MEITLQKKIYIRFCLLLIIYTLHFSEYKTKVNRYNINVLIKRINLRISKSYVL